MKKLWTICCGLVALAGILAIAGTSMAPATATTSLSNADINVTLTKDVEYPAVAAAVLETDDGSSAQRTTAKEAYYAMWDRVVLGAASPAEVAEFTRLAMQWNLPLPQGLTEEENGDRGDEGNLDQGGTDTVSNCAGATVIPACPFNDSGNFDGDNECSVSAASPSNEVFYSFVAPSTGLYQMRVRSQSGGVAAIRVMSNACCVGATSIAFSSSTVATDCPRIDSTGNEPSTSVTYLSVSLTGGVTYWIHVGTSSSTAGIVAAYQFNLWCVGCPTAEQDGRTHPTCDSAAAIAVNDSVFGDSAYVSATTWPDWYVFTKTGYDTLEIFVGGREFGHCISGRYPSSTPVAGVDGRFTVFQYNGTCPGDSLVKYDDEGCSLDAKGRRCYGPGTYYIKVWNYGVQEYVLSIRDVADCPEPIDCNTLFPCGSPAEVEPNNTCADAANFIALACTPGAQQVVYGTSCPQNDVDYYYIPAFPAGSQIDIQLFDGPNCDQATGGLSMRGATSAGACGNATGTATRRYLIGSACYPSNQGWFGVVRTSGAESPYKITVDCYNIAPACPEVVLPKQFCAGPCAVNILPLGVTTSTQSVSLNEVIDDVNVRINATHSYDGDMIFRLVSPWADTLNLISRRGGSGDNFQITLLDDEATTAISAGVAPFNGSFIPEEPLSQLDGYNALGNWTLIARDTVSGDSGFVLCWCLEFESHVPCTPTGVVAFQADNDNVGSYPAYVCAQLCAGAETQIVICSVDGHPLDPSKTPIVSVTSGCSPASSRCDVQCDPGSLPFDGIIPLALWTYNEGTGCFEVSLPTVTPGCVCVCLEGFLGVELSAFDATVGDGQVTLNWTTASETNNSRFEINRDGTLVGTIEGQGNSTTATNYSWTDRELSNGTTYAYTLITVDGNGGRSEAGTINATPTASAVVTAYALSQNFPNPFNPETMISFDLVDAGFVNLKVYNVLGQAVAELVNRNMEAGRHLVSFQAGDLPSGIYLYRLEANGFVAQKKMVLMK